MIRKSRWLTFMLSMIPGLGHLYLGFAKQGLQYMIGACVCIILIPSIPMLFPFALAILWFYQLFDALQKASWMKAAAMEHERMMMGQDTFGYPWTERDWIQMNGYQKESAVHPFWIGAACIGMGILVLLVGVFPGLWEWLLNRNITSVLLAVGLIVYGMWLLGKRPNHKGSEHL